MKTKHPRYLYKYYSLSRFTKPLFKKGEIFFPKANILNDPFEASFILDFEATEKIKISYFLKHHIEFHKKTYSEKLNYISQIESKSYQDQMDWAYKTHLFTHGIFSMCKSYKSILMWSHYAKSHAGFCIEIDTEDPSIKDNLYKTIYINRPKKLNIYFENNYCKYLKYKSTDWLKEEEYRTISKPGKRKLKQESVTMVFIPVNFSNNWNNKRQSNHAAFILKNYNLFFTNAKLYYLEPDKHRFKLKIQNQK